MDINSIMAGTTGAAGGQDANQSRIQTEMGLGRDEFLKLLSVQLQHQDPLDPMDGRDFVAELSQFASLEQLTGMAGGMDKLDDRLNAMLIEHRSLSSLSLIGRMVDLESGLSGRVDGVRMEDGFPKLGLDTGVWIDPADILQVRSVWDGASGGGTSD